LEGTADFIMLFKHQYLETTLGKPATEISTDRPGADNDDIKFRHSTHLLRPSATYDGYSPLRGCELTACSGRLEFDLQMRFASSPGLEL
jgi:hypothetical protein